MPILSGVNPWRDTVLRNNLVGVDLAAAIKRKKLTTAKAAAQIGVNTSTLSGIISGTANPGRENLNRCLTWLAG